MSEVSEVPNISANPAEKINWPIQRGLGWAGERTDLMARFQASGGRPEISGRFIERKRT